MSEAELEAEVRRCARGYEAARIAAEAKGLTQAGVDPEGYQMALARRDRASAALMRARRNYALAVPDAPGIPDETPTPSPEGAE